VLLVFLLVTGRRPSLVLDEATATGEEAR